MMLFFLPIATLSATGLWRNFSLLFLFSFVFQNRVGFAVKNREREKIRNLNEGFEPAPVSSSFFIACLSFRLRPIMPDFASFGSGGKS